LNQLWPPLNFNSERDNVVSSDIDNMNDLRDDLYRGDKQKKPRGNLSP
jgi:hypothetical protein